jgi:hypothetical protein
LKFNSVQIKKKSPDGEVVAIEKQEPRVHFRNFGKRSNPLDLFVPKINPVTNSQLRLKSSGNTPINHLVGGNV